MSIQAGQTAWWVDYRNDVYSGVVACTSRHQIAIQTGEGLILVNAADAHESRPAAIAQAAKALMHDGAMKQRKAAHLLTELAGNAERGAES